VKKWFINWLGLSTPLTIGSRIETRHGWGTVTTGTLIVELDVSPYADTGKKTLYNQKHWTFNLKELAK
jgi:hypothetical protein